MAWQNCVLLLPHFFFTFSFLFWIFPEVSSGQNVRCWWNNVTYDGQRVSIECRADPPRFLQKCGRCQLQLITSGTTTQAELHQCSRNNAYFTTVLSQQAMQDVQATLSCPEQKPEDCMIKEGYPPPTCLIPDFEYESMIIHCYWNHHSSNLHNITLHWEEFPKSMHQGDSPWEGDRGRIPRSEFSLNFQNIRVWVSAVSALGSLYSDFAEFDTGSIREPVPPVVTNVSFDPLEIFWDVERELDSLEICHCEVRYKNEWQQFWTEVEGPQEVFFVLSHTEPFTNYTFLFRCGFGAYEEGITMSNWTSFTVVTPAAAPVGSLDVWSVCDLDSHEPSCNILWKELPKNLAKSKISSYQMSVRLNIGSELRRAEYRTAECAQCELMMNLSINEAPRALQSRLTCVEEQSQCCVQVPIQEVKGIWVTANSPEGQTSPALVALPITGFLIPEVQMKVKIESRFLEVRWSAPPKFTEGIQEYVVQYKCIGLPHQPCLNWAKVNKTRTSVTLSGQFCNYTRYHVSLFAIINNRSHLIQSEVGYAVQGVPPKVTDLKVTEFSPFKVKLTWKPIPLENSRGFILKYLMGISNHTVWNVSKDENSTHVPCELVPGRQYEVWICGVTVAGEGEKTTVLFSTAATDYNIPVIVVVTCLFFLIFVILVVGLILYCSRSQEILRRLKVPDPINSKLFQSMNNQFRQSWLSPPSTSEYTLTISQVEVFIPESHPDPEEEEDEFIVDLPEVEQQRTQLETDRDREQDGDSDEDLHEPGRLETGDSRHLRGTNNYRQMLDSSEEEASREDEDEEWEEQASPSDYEKHFMPCIQDT